MAMANDLIVLFLGLETLSIAVYVLSAMHLRRAQSQESGLKYFVLGAFSSAFLLYGIALIYGATGSTNLVGIRNYFGPSSSRRAAVAGHVPIHGGLILLGPRPAAGRPRLQGRGRAVPLLEPRRLRRRAHARRWRSWPARSRPPPSPPWSASSC